MFMRVMSGIGKKFEKLFKGPLTYVFAHILCVQLPWSAVYYNCNVCLLYTSDAADE